jgi:protein-L-isoaspartate(D-aspartate) O-methyltransferase
MTFGGSDGSERLVAAARTSGVRSPRVLEALRSVPRERFVPPAERARANLDVPVPIPHRLVTTQPSLVARMVEALELGGDERVLEIGTGLGYQAAILATLAREVFSIERFPDLADQAHRNLIDAGITNVSVVVGDGTQGLAAAAPFDAIVVAAAAPRVPAALGAQLVEHGRLVQPIGPGGAEVVTAFHREGEELVSDGSVTYAHFVPLVSGPTR